MLPIPKIRKTALPQATILFQTTFSKQKLLSTYTRELHYEIYILKIMGGIKYKNRLCYPWSGGGDIFPNMINLFRNVKLK